MEGQNELTVVQPANIDAPRTVQEVRADINLIQQVMKDCMKSGTHYGTVPGCGDKPTLLKAGAEKLLSTFRLGCDPEVTDLSDGMIIRYRVKARAFTPSGITVGYGVGECSTAEDKYGWRKAVNQDEFNATPDTHRRIKYTYKGNIQQVKTNPADVANTVLKMAKKRAQVDLCLTVCGASDIFTQDIEEMPPELLGDRAPAPRATVTRPASRPAAAVETGGATRPTSPPPSGTPANTQRGTPTEEPSQEPDFKDDLGDPPAELQDGCTIESVGSRTGKSKVTDKKTGEITEKPWELFIIHTSDGDMSTFNADWAKLVASTSGTSTRWIIPTNSKTITLKNGTTQVRKEITEQPRKA
jgi:hypothetical protein